MAQMAEVARGEGCRRTESRVSKTPIDHFRIVKQQLQTINNAQTKLHTMFEEMIQELETTKANLDAAQKELADTKAKLIHSNSRAKQLESYLTGRLTACLHIIRQRNRELESEREKVKECKDAQEKLEQLKKQWTALSTILSDGPSSPTTPAPNSSLTLDNPASVMPRAKETGVGGTLLPPPPYEVSLI